MPHFDTMIRKLRTSSTLNEDDIDAIRALPMHVREFASGTKIVAEGDTPQHSCLVIKGFCLRSKVTDEGKRQILSIHVPGDVPDLQSLHIEEMDHDFIALSTCTLGLIPHQSLRDLTRARPLVAEALWRESLLDAAIFREWIVNVGRRNAHKRLVHLLLEIREKLIVARLCTSATFELPMTQQDLADALGLTPVHVNRVVKSLRAQGLLEIKRSEVRLLDLPHLSSLSGFESTYLHPAADREAGRVQPELLPLKAI